LADMSLGDDEIVEVEIVVVFCIGDRRLQAFAHVTRDTLAREFEVGERHRHLLAPDQLRDKVELLRAHPQHAGDCLGFVVGEAPWALLLAHRISPQLVAGLAAAPGAGAPAPVARGPGPPGTARPAPTALPSASR